MALRRRVLLHLTPQGLRALAHVGTIGSDQQFTGLMIEVQVSALGTAISGVEVGATPQGVVPAVAEQVVLAVTALKCVVPVGPQGSDERVTHDEVAFEATAEHVVIVRTAIDLVGAIMP